MHCRSFDVGSLMNIAYTRRSAFSIFALRHQAQSRSGGQVLATCSGFNQARSACRPA
jgi:hypothetical protein